jgi:hypothetical protein
MYNNDMINIDVADQRQHLSPRPQKVSIVDIKMPFWSMVVFMVKATLASIPALIILTIISLILVALSAGILAALHVHL